MCILLEDIAIEGMIIDTSGAFLFEYNRAIFLKLIIV